MRLLLAALFLALPLSGCSKTPKVEKGAGVRFEYAITDEKDMELGGGMRLSEYIHGRGELLPALERAFEGHRAGDEFSVTVPPEAGYGGYHTDQVREFPLSKLPSGQQPAVGKRLQAPMPDGTVITAVIKEIRPKTKTVVLDFNHPLAGRTLTYHIIIKQIYTPKPQPEGDKK